MTDINVNDDINENTNKSWWLKAPKLINTVQKTFSSNNPLFGNCLKGCKWAPDGSCICTNSEDHRIRVFNLPSQFYSFEKVNIEDDIFKKDLIPDLEFRESQIIYDYCWFPSMNSADAATCFLLCASRDVPVHLWDAYTGKITASYVTNNYVHELLSGRSVCFSRDGLHIIVGYEKFISIFDVARPGATGQLVDDVPNGIVSCLGSGSKMFASGSFSKLIGLYDGTTCQSIAKLQGQQGGVTHLSISPDDNRLYSGGRKDDEILCWDLRNYGTILHIIKRSCRTNQRVQFDLDYHNGFLTTGDDRGIITFYDVNSNITDKDDDDDKLIPQINQFKSHSCCANGVGLHPTLPLMAVTSGQRPTIDFDESCDEHIFEYSKQYCQDTNMKFWWFG